ncbi:peptidoglycan recognition family protein [Spongiactinospora sp. TRM90649]|uniref:peptidoglycan recognition protein family protein n=1 Tax=Spongiactinospora sp. TRM90649 TaxID=3031114 RepID=UPI0023F66E08|nr:peptidoglycan recognition family protein [Spongiactinospora sp. TRM90649]MDF5755833.1 peptidoglycan recognition family protein [Spongiactinospora sp. TRM90649]
MTVIESRASWGARRPRSTSYLASARGVKAHYTGGHVDPATLTDHDACRVAVRGIQRGHMNGNGWSDIGYSMVVCGHDRAMIGRGPHVLPAANGAGLNSGHYAILVLVGSSGVTQITPAMKKAFHGARDYLRERGSAGPEVKGHRDGYATDCPGPSVYAWVKAGAPLPADPPKPQPPDPAAPPEEDEEMPEIVSLGLEDEVVVPPGVDYQPWWTAEWKDTAGWHPPGGQSIAPNTDVWADVVAHVSLRGFTPGDLVRLGLTRHQADGTLVDVAWPNGRLWTVRADLDGRVEHDLAGHFKLSSANRARVSVRHAAAGEVVLETASAFKGILHRYA